MLCVLCFRVVFFFFLFFSFLFPLLLQGIHKNMEYFLWASGVYILFMCEPERKIKGRSKAMLTSGSHHPQVKWGRITWMGLFIFSLFLPLREPNKLSERKEGSWHVITQRPGHLLNQWKTQFCPVLDRDESPQRELDEDILRFFFGIMFEDFIIVTVIQQETREDFTI